MAITAQELNIILSAKDKQFSQAMDRANRKVAGFAKKSQTNLNKTSRSFKTLGDAAKRVAPLLATALGVRAAQNAANMAVQVGRLASISGTTVTEFQRFAAAARTVGIEQEKASDILKDMNDRVGDFLSTGGGPMKDFFEQVAPLVGVTADQFRNLSGPQSLQLFVDTLEKAGASQQDFTFYLEAMASDATALLPILRNGGEELTKIGDAAQNSGRLFKDEAVDGATQFQIKMQELSDKINSEFVNSLVALEDEIALLGQFVTDYGVPAFESLVSAAGSTVSAINMVVTKFRELKGLDGESDLFGSRDTEGLEADLKDMITRRSAVQNQIKNLLDGRDPSELGFLESNRLSNSLGMGMLDTVNRLNQEIEMTKLVLQAMKGEVAGTGADPFNASGNALQIDIPRAPGADRHPPAVPPKGLSNNPDPTGSNADAALDARKEAYASLLAQLMPATIAETQYAEQVQIINAALEDGLTTREMANTLIEQSGINASRAADELSGMAEVTDALEQGLTNTFMAALEGTKSMEDAFKNMAREVIAQLYRVLVVQQMVNAAMGLFGFSPATGGGFTRTRAGGGQMQAGQTYMTGESGRELFVPSTPGRLLSPAQTKDALGDGGGGVVVNQTINVSTGVQQTVRSEIKSLMPQISDSAKMAVLDAKRRGGTFGRAF